MKVVALRKALVQQNQLDELRTIGAALRPDIAWDDLCIGTPAAPDTTTSNASDRPDQSITNQASNLGAQGTFYGPVSFGGPSPRTVTWPVRFLPADLPAGYIARPAALQALRTTLLKPQAHVGVVAATALHGAGGLGKTVLARAICKGPAIQQRYKDGVLWATLGQSADPARHQRNWIAALGGDLAAASDPNRGKVELQKLLAERKMLLILDDVWNSQDAEPLQVSALGCGVLLATRDAWRVVTVARTQPRDEPTQVRGQRYVCSSALGAKTPFE